MMSLCKVIWAIKEAEEEEETAVDFRKPLMKTTIHLPKFDKIYAFNLRIIYNLILNNLVVFK